MGAAIVSPFLSCTRQFSNRNCSPRLGSDLVVMQVDHMGGVAGQCDLDGDEGVVFKCGHGVEIA